MAKIWKEVLLPGRQRDKSGEWYEFTPADILDAHRNLRKMLGRKVPLPAVWEHVGVEANSPDDRKAAYAKYTFGHITDGRVNDRGALELLHEVRDPADVEQLLKTKFVSPKVFPSYSDSRGGTYHGTTIAHVAATPSPVQFWQRPFELSRAGALYLSYTPEDHAVADEDKGEKKSEGGEKKSEGGGEKAKTGIDAVIAALKEVGFSIPDEVTDETGLVIAIKASGGPGGGGDNPDEDLDDYGQGGGGEVGAAGGPPVMMSTLDRDPGRRAQAKAWASDERRDLLGRVKQLFQSGRIDRPTAKALQRQAKAVEMSFTPECEASSPLHKKLAELEKRSANSAWRPAGGRPVELSATNMGAVGRPKELSGDAKDESVTDWMCAGLPARK
jgi:hypothetical protein